MTFVPAATVGEALAAAAQGCACFSPVLTVV